MASDHRWHLDAAEVDRHVRRRGRPHAFDELVAPRTALIVVDMVPFFVADQPYALGTVPRINRLAAALRIAGGTVAWLAPAATDGPTERDVAFYGPEVAARYAAAAGEGPVPARLWPGLAIDDEDLFVEKRSPSPFFAGSSDLHHQLEERAIDTVLVAGTVANVCCESTVRDAHALGHRVVMVADANAAPTDQMVNATLRTVYRSFGDVRPTSDIIGLL